MIKYFKIIFVIIIGLLIGIIIHGAIEIPVIFLLISTFKDFFLRVSWNVWLLIHHIFTVIIEFLGIFLAFRSYKKFNRI